MAKILSDNPKAVRRRQYRREHPERSKATLLRFYIHQLLALGCHVDLSDEALALLAACPSKDGEPL